jgi:hypothetical protein
MPAKFDLTGLVSGRLTVLSCEGKRAGNYLWACRCECGGSALVTSHQLRRQTRPTRSCGCLQPAHALTIGARKKTHGKSKTQTYRIWHQMLDRCRNPKSTVFAYYGGRGISVCERWRSFENFFADMGERPEGRSIERNDVNGSYEPGNCRWATDKEQNLNKRNTVYMELRGVRKPMMEWAEELGISYDALKGRRKLGWSDERALTEPSGTTPGYFTSERAKAMRQREAAERRAKAPAPPAVVYRTNTHSR